MEKIHTNGIEMIQQLQSMFQDSSDVMLTMSHLGDPRNAFLIYFPLAYCLHKPTGIHMLWLASISEWINALLKWVLHGHRPFWWVPESGLYSANVTVIEQYRLTCETGPGSPSGHAMVTACVLFCMVAAGLKHCDCRPVTKVITWLVYIVFLLAVNVSRLYIATHFPHQVFLGTLTGIGITILLERCDFSSFSLWTHLVISTAIPATCVLTFYIIQWLDLDPQWSISMATKHCARKEWIHLDTTLFNAVYRDAGSILGLAMYGWFSAVLEKRLTPSLIRIPEPLPYFIRVIHIVLALYLCQLGENVKPAQTSAIFYYTFTYFKFAILVCLVMVVTNLFTRGKRLDVVLRPFDEKKNE